MRFHTTCAACGANLTVADHHHRTCPDCPPSPDPGDTLERAFLAAAAVDDNHHQQRADQLAAELDAHENRPPHLLGAALTYATWGWPVFPIKPGHKTPLTRHGLHDATTDPMLLRSWWATWPQANIGLPTGHRFDVVDVDPAGLAWWTRMRLADHPDDVFHGQVSTPRGGYHLYRLPTGAGNLADFAPGVDFRGTGGYVLAPPSVLVADAITHGPVPSWPLRYTWLVRPSPSIAGGAG